MPKFQKTRRVYSRRKRANKQLSRRKYVGGVSFNAPFSSDQIPSRDMIPLNSNEVNPQLPLIGGLSSRTLVGGKTVAKRRRYAKRARLQRKRIVGGGTSDALLGTSVHHPVIGTGTSGGTQSVYSNFISGPAAIPGAPIPFSVTIPVIGRVLV